MADFARSESPAVQKQLDRLSKASAAGDQLGLARITALLERLGNPHDSLPPAIHVAGTNGKGSTCAFLRAILAAAGLSVHTFTSPHLVRFNERIRIAGALVGDRELAALLREVIDSGAGIDPTFFEVTTAAAFLGFARTPADACVIEVGLGGRLDSTNVLNRPLSTAIAGLGIDHGQWLGRTLAEIAGEKAAIAKSGVPLVTQRYTPAAAQVVQQTAEKAGAQWVARGALWNARIVRDHLHYRDRLGGLTLPLPRLRGRHQADNAALAVAILRHQDLLPIPDDAMAEGIRTADWPARLQPLGNGPLLGLVPKGSEIWIDGGHNGHAARSVADHFRRSDPNGLPLVLIFGCLTSKQPRSILRPFQDLASTIVTVPVPDHDSLTPESLASLADELGFQASLAANLETALKRIDAPSRVLIFGSLYLAGAALQANGFRPS
jgi:dihydrofolate synthase/folylpolyglutamate synthase